MKLKNILPIFVAVLGLFASCSEDDIINNLSEIQVSESSVAIPMTGGETTITVKANDSWTLVYPTDKKGNNTAEWLTASATSGNAGETELKFSAPATDAGRAAEMKIVCGSKTQYLRVNQGTTQAVPSTCAEVLAGPENKNYQVTGTVTKISNTTYGNWYIKDATGEVYIYGTLDKNGGEKNFASLGIDEGDQITVQGPKSVYNGTVELVNVTVVKLVKSMIKVDSVTVNGVKGTELPLEGGDVKVFCTVKGDGVSFDGSKVPSWLHITSVDQKGTTAVVSIHADANEGSAREGSVDLTSKNSKNSSTVNVALSQLGKAKPVIGGTISAFNAAAKGTEATITGQVTKVAGKYFFISDYTAETEVYGATDAAGNAFDVKVGDVVTVKGKRDEYKGTVEMTGYTIVSKVSTETVTIAELNAKPDGDALYTVTGTVTKIVNTKYGNMYIKDAAGNELYIYGTLNFFGTEDNQNFIANTGLKVGDTVTVVGPKTTFKGNVEMVNAFVTVWTMN